MEEGLQTQPGRGVVQEDVMLGAGQVGKGRKGVPGRGNCICEDMKSGAHETFGELHWVALLGTKDAGEEARGEMMVRHQIMSDPLSYGREYELL